MPGQSALPDLLVELALTPDPAAGYLRAAFTMVANNPSSLYEDMTALADYAIQPGDCLEYDVYWEGATQQVGLDLGFSDGSYFHTGNWALDQNGLGAWPNVDLSAQANGQWYHRVIPLGAVGSPVLGLSITKWLIASDKGNLGAGGTFTGRFREILITDGAGTVKASIWRQTDGIPTVAVDSQSPGSGNSLALSRVNEAPVWTDITAYVLEVSIDRGRKSGSGPTDPGTLSLRLDNRDRRFDPSNTASPYYPYVIPRRRIRVSAIKSAVTYRRFTGFVSRVPPKWQGRNAEVAIEATDGFKALAAKQISGFRAVEQSGARINWALDQGGWATADRAVDAGNSQVEQSGSSTGTLLDQVAALEHLQDVADAEVGEFFIDGAGLATFLQRQRRVMAFSASQGTFSNVPGGGEFLYTDWTPSFDEEAIFNDIHVRPIAATSDSIAGDYASQAKYLPSTLSRVVWLTTLTEALNQAEWLLARYKQPALQIDAIHLEPKRQDALWAQVLARSLGDRITVKFTPYGGGVTINEDAYIESISEHIDCSGGAIDWTIDWSLSPADTQAYWVLGDASNSLLGISTVLGY